eukprot:scaffold22713_cov139-Cylindrotheca_fusiformis.AAC.16
MMRVIHRTNLLLFLLLVRFSDAQPSYSNVTLTADNGDLEVVIYLPQGIKPGESSYYVSTRFDHSSMIGNIKRTTRKEDGSKETHILYDTDQWRIPHDPYWTESGLGLASEFGVGDDGAFCNFLCGWDQENEVTNGVLGYREAKSGESFLKIGVGELIKGSCNACDSTDDYKFNSPYQFANMPVWTLEEHPEENSISLINEATLNQHGYILRKDISLKDDELFVRTTLTNLGREPFATAWYSHHFFTCDGNPVGKGYGVDLDVAGTSGDYDEPAAWFWSTPLKTYAAVTPSKNVVDVEMQRGVERDVRIKAEFVKDDKSSGDFTIRGCGNSIKESIPEVGSPGGPSMYAFNLYVETGTFSPEPQIYLHFYPGETISWTQHLEFRDQKKEEPKARLGWFGLQSVTNPSSSSPKKVFRLSFLITALISAVVTVLLHTVWKRKRRGYSAIADTQ